MTACTSLLCNVLHEWLETSLALWCALVYHGQGVPGILLTDPIMDLNLKLCTMIYHGEM
jgi:hypothetical protein